MMGDNRYYSKDSRYWGVVPRDNIRGRPMFVYYSYVPGSRRRRFALLRPAERSTIPFDDGHPVVAIGSPDSSSRRRPQRYRA